MGDKREHIVICSGKSKADFLATGFEEQGHKLTIINEDKEYAKYLSSKHSGTKVVVGEPYKIYVLDDAKVHNADVLIALCDRDTDNYVLAKAAQKMFGVKKVVVTVENPKNVEIFKRLGINTVISSTFTISNMIEQATVLGEIAESLSLDEEGIEVNKVTIDADSPVIGKQILDIPINSKVNISAIVRETGVVVPNGQTIINLGDKLIVISAPEHKKHIYKVLTGKNVR